MDSQREGLIEELERLIKECEERDDLVAAFLISAVWAALLSNAAERLARYVLPYALLEADREEAQP